MKLIVIVVKYFFLADTLFLGVVVDFSKYIFSWLPCFILGGGHNLIRVVLQWGKYGIKIYTLRME
jgi:hypothetical protein